MSKWKRDGCDALRITDGEEIVAIGMDITTANMIIREHNAHAELLAACQRLMGRAFTGMRRREHDADFQAAKAALKLAGEQPCPPTTEP